MSSYALSRLPQQHKYEDLVAGLAKKSKASSNAQLLLFYEKSWDESLVAPCVRVLQENGKGGGALCVQIHHLLRLAAPRVAKSPSIATSLEGIENMMIQTRTTDLGASVAAVWTLATYSRFADEPRRSFLAAKVVDWFAKVLESSKPDAKDPLDAIAQVTGLSACLSLGPLVLSLSQVKAPLWPLILKCFNCEDPVAVRHALKLLLERSISEPGSCTSVVQGLLYSLSSINLRDALARVYFLQLCSLDPIPAAVTFAENSLEDLSFRVVLEAITLLSSRSWDLLPHQKMIAPIIAAFQAPRPVLHYSALRACHLVGRAHARSRATTPLQALLPLVMVQVQHDSVSHRWRALIALAWLTNDPEGLVSGVITTEIRLGEISSDLFSVLLGELSARAAVSASPDWGSALLSCLSGALGHSSKLLTDPELLGGCWQAALLCGAQSAKVLASVVLFAQFPFPASRFAFTTKLLDQIAIFYGKNFGLLRGAKGAAQTIVVFLEGLILASNSRVALEALLSVAAVEERDRIRGFLDSMVNAGFDQSFVQHVVAARKKIGN